MDGGIFRGFAHQGEGSRGGVVTSWLRRERVERHPVG